jgi:hypothetical protein
LKKANLRTSSFPTNITIGKMSGVVVMAADSKVRAGVAAVGGRRKTKGKNKKQKQKKKKKKSREKVREKRTEKREEGWQDLKKPHEAVAGPYQGGKNSNPSLRASLSLKERERSSEIVNLDI